MKHHRAVDRVAGILELAAESDDGVTLTQLAERLDAPKSSLHSLISGLVAVGYLVEHAGRYLVGPGLGMVLTASRRQPLTELTRKVREQLNEDTQETIVLGVPVGTSVVYVDQIESPQRIRYAAPMHQRRPMHHTSMGKVFLADLPEPRVCEIVRGEEPTDGFTWEGLFADLAEVRETGYCVNRKLPLSTGFMGIAAGFRDSTGSLVGALSVRGPAVRMTEVLDDHVASLLDATQHIHELLVTERPPSIEGVPGDVLDRRARV